MDATGSPSNIQCRTFLLVQLVFAVCVCSAGETGVTALDQTSSEPTGGGVLSDSWGMYLYIYTLLYIYFMYLCV